VKHVEIDEPPPTELVSGLYAARTTSTLLGRLAR
jgi:hypothetical protein